MLRGTLAASKSHVLVRSEHPKGAWSARLLRETGRRFVDRLAPGAELSILVVTDRRVRALNRDFRQKDKATDVLSFEQNPAQGLLGDVVISLDTARRQAKEGGRPLRDELDRLLAHGVLHLLGHDHETNARDARKMAKAEVELLGTVGLVGDALDHPAELEFRRVRSARPAARTPRGKETAR